MVSISSGDVNSVARLGLSVANSRYVTIQECFQGAILGHCGKLSCCRVQYILTADFLYPE